MQPGELWRWGLFLLSVSAGISGTFGTAASTTSQAAFIFSLPALSVLSLPEQGLAGEEVELSLGALVQGAPLIVVVKSNVPWAVTARVLAEPGAVFFVATVDGPEVAVGAEEVLLLSGRPGKHELRLHFGQGPGIPRTEAKLLLRVRERR